MSFRTFFDYVIIAIIQSWNVLITLKCSFVPVVGAYPLPQAASAVLGSKILSLYLFQTNWLDSLVFTLNFFFF